MSSETNDPKPTWTDPAPTTITPAPAVPAGPATPAGSPPVAPPAGAPPVAPTATAVTPVGPVTPVQATKPRQSGAWVNVLLGVAAVIANGGVAFAIGRSTAPASAASVGTLGNRNGGFVFTPGGSFDPNNPPAGGFGGRGLFGTGGPTIEGKVASITADGMTITLASGDTMTVKTDGSTTYHQSTAATASDVAVGDQVAVRVNGGRFRTNGNGNGAPNASAAPNTTTDSLTATDVTVSR